MMNGNWVYIREIHFLYCTSLACSGVSDSGYWDDRRQHYHVLHQPQTQHNKRVTCLTSISELLKSIKNKNLIHCVVNSLYETEGHTYIQLNECSWYWYCNTIFNSTGIYERSMSVQADDTTRKLRILETLMEVTSKKISNIRMQKSRIKNDNTSVSSALIKAS